MADSQKQQLEKQLAALKNERSSYVTHWQELSEFIIPRNSRFLVSDRNKDKRNTKIVDPTATMANRVLSSGMMSGITSPSRPWFKLATPDPDMMDFGPVKIWLDDVQNKMNEMFNRSNLYQSLPIMYSQLGTFGTATMAVVEDSHSIIRTYPFPIGSYYLSNNDRLLVDNFYREYSMTVRQIVSAFGIDNCSQMVKSAYNNGNYEQWIDVVHVVKPNLDRDSGKLDSKNKAYISIYYEKGGDGNQLLSEKGFDDFPIMAPRWEINGEDVYGCSCPGMIALGGVKALQLEQKRKFEIIDKASNPPMIAPASLKNQRINMTPGSVSYVNELDPSMGLRPAYLVNPSTADLLADIQDTRELINNAYFVDLFMMLANNNPRSMPVEAVIEMKEEKLLMLGPVLERLNDEFLDPLIERAFSIMSKNNLLPDAPPAMHGVPLKIEYISVMAQAQKSIGVSSIQSLTSFVGSLAQMKPDALDKLDADQCVDSYAEMIGVSPNLIVPEDQVQQIRQQREQQQQQQQMMQASMAATQAAKNLGDAQMSEPSVLSGLMGGAVNGGQ